MIDLFELTRGEVRSLSGHDRGLAARAHYGLNDLDAKDAVVVVRAPNDLDALTPSFVQGLFAQSVHRLGKDVFFKHYKFDLPEHLRTDIELGINRAMMKRNIAGTN